MVGSTAILLAEKESPATDQLRDICQELDLTLHAAKGGLLLLVSSSESFFAPSNDSHDSISTF
jgi:hypothetical protein